MLKVDFIFLSLPRELVFYSTLDYKDFVNPTGCGSLDEMEIWSLVEKNPKEMGVLEKHNTKVSL
jgi:hypothetical protein